jgi:hypothetical protein
MNIQHEEVERIKSVIGRAVEPIFPMVLIWNGKKWIGYRSSRFAMLIMAWVVAATLVGIFLR